MQTEEEIASSSMMDPWSIFLYGMKAPMTREKYEASVFKYNIPPEFSRYETVFKIEAEGFSTIH